MCVCVRVSVCVCQLQVCPCDKLWQIQARITKFRPDGQNTFVKIPIVFRVDWFWFRVQIAWMPVLATRVSRQVVLVNLYSHSRPLHGHHYILVSILYLFHYQSIHPFLKYNYFRIWPWKSKNSMSSHVWGQSWKLQSGSNQYHIRPSSL